MRPSHETTRVWFGALACAALVLGAAGCSQKVGQSGFLSSYDGMKHESGNMFVYLNPSDTLGQYDKIMIDPIVVHFAPSSKGHTISPENVQEITSYAEEKLRKELSKNYQVVTQPGPGVLRIRAAITDVQKANTVLNAIPHTKVTGAGLGGASFEAEGLDAQTGVRVAAIMDTRKGSQFDVRGLHPMDNAKQVIDYWVRDLVKRLNEAHDK